MPNNARNVRSSKVSKDSSALGTTRGFGGAGAGAGAGDDDGEGDGTRGVPDVGVIFIRLSRTKVSCPAAL